MPRITRPTLLSAFGALTLLSLAALPWWLGWQAEKTYRALLDELATTTGATTAVRHYDRGWLRSEVESEIRFGDTAPAFVVQLRLDHGPLALEGLAPVMAYVRGELRPTELAGAAPVAPLIFEGATDLRGTTRLTFAWPAGQLPVASGALAWQPLHGSLSIERDAQHLAWQLETPALHFTGEAGADWRIEALQLRAALREGIAGFPLGNIAGSAVRLAHTPDEVIEDGKLSVSAHFGGEGLMLAVGAQLRSWKHGAETFGPGELALEVRRLDPSALMPLLRSLPALSRPAEASATTAKFTPLAIMLARKAPEAEFTALRLKKDADELTGRGRLLFDGRRLGANVPAGRLLTALSGEFELSMPVALAHAWFLPTTPRTDDSRDGGGRATRGAVAEEVERRQATAGMPEVEQRRERLPEQSPRVTPGAGTELPTARQGSEAERLDDAPAPDEMLSSHLRGHPYGRLLVPTETGYRLTASLKQGRLLINNEPWHGALLPAP